MTIPVLAALLAAAPAWADRGCRGPMADWQPREAVERLALRHGWTLLRIRIEHGCYELIATDAAGRRIEAIADPATLEIIGSADGDDAGHGHAHDD